MNHKIMSLTKNNIIDLKKFTTKKLSFNTKEIGTYSKKIDIIYDEINNPIIIFPRAPIIKLTNDSKNNYEITVSYDVENIYNFHKFIQLWNIATERKVKQISPNINISYPHYYFDKNENGYRKKYLVMSFKTTQNTKYFDKNKKHYSHCGINVGDEIGGAIYTKGIFLDGDGATQRWTAHQVIALTNNLNISPNK